MLVEREERGKIIFWDTHTNKPVRSGTIQK